MRYIFLTTLFSLSLLEPVSAQKIVVGSCTLKDGGIYTGDLVSGKPTGKGRVQYENGDTYEGAFYKGCLLYTSPSPRD